MKIILWPDPKLKIRSRTVDQPPNPAFLASLFDTMEKAGGVGLSAIQVGIPERLFVCRVGGERRVFVNPEWYVPVHVVNGRLEPLFPRVPMLEGCLSTPGLFETTHRFPQVDIGFQDEKMERHRERVKDLLAQVVQHETEHTLGQMFTDHLKSADRSRIMGHMLKLKRRGGR